METKENNSIVYWIDRFSVPQSSMPKFMQSMAEIYDYVGNMDGCLRSNMLKSYSRNEHVNVVAIVEWKNSTAMEAAQQALVNWRCECGFNPFKFEASLGVESDFNEYSAVAV